MAPEILLKHSYSPLADLWSIGVILYECIFGRAPYSSKSLDELLHKIKTKQKIIISPSAAISTECRDILTRLLIHEPDQRITFQEFFDHPFLSAKIQHLKQVATDEVQYNHLFVFVFVIFFDSSVDVVCVCFFIIRYSYRIWQKPLQSLHMPFNVMNNRIIGRHTMHIAKDFNCLCHWLQMKPMLKRDYFCNKLQRIIWNVLRKSNVPILQHWCIRAT